MKRFAANRIYDFSTQTMYRNSVVEVEEGTHCVVGLFGLQEEIRHTEWKGGIILLCAEQPDRKEEESFAAFKDRIQQLSLSYQHTSLHAYHITAFDVNAMEFTSGSRILSLY